MPPTVQNMLKSILARTVYGRIKRFKTSLPARETLPGAEAQAGGGEKNSITGQERSTAQLVDNLIYEAFNKNASDIHLEPVENGLRVRLRVDGALQDYTTYNSGLSLLIVSRLKITAGMDIADKRLPQDGNLQLELGGKKVNIRASTMPTIYGEKIALRLLDPERIVIPIQNLGFNDLNRQRYLKFLESAYGMVLVTGPTGCGKTTTLYSTLHYINDPAENIITVENPVEYRLEGITQVQVNNKIKLTFANALRTILRQDPNVVMVGEIRDLDTAEVATRAALTGHLVFSTLHTNDAPRAVTRLMDMGVEPYLLDASLIGVVAQRLVRLVCLNCRENYESEEELSLYREITGDSDKFAFVKGRGCELCSGTGYLGRTAIHEVMPVDVVMRRLILGAKDTEVLRRRAVEGGMKTLLQDGMQRVKDGQTTFQEVMKEAYSTF